MKWAPERAVARWREPGDKMDDKWQYLKHIVFGTIYE